MSEQQRGIIHKEDGRIFLIKCPKCGTENYPLNVPTGICTWCGYSAHKKESAKAEAGDEN